MESAAASAQVINTFDGVADYLLTYKKLPDNYITKAQAQALGWVASKGNLAEVAPGKSIGGDVFSNREGRLPAKAAAHGVKPISIIHLASETPTGCCTPATG